MIFHIQNGHHKSVVLQEQSMIGPSPKVGSFSQSPLIGSLSNLQVMRTGIKARTSSNLGQIGLFTLELFALEHRFLIPGAIYMY